MPRASIFGAIVGQRDRKAAIASRLFNRLIAAGPHATTALADRTERMCRAAAMNGWGIDLFRLAFVLVTRTGIFDDEDWSGNTIARMAESIQLLADAAADGLEIAPDRLMQLLESLSPRQRADIGYSLQ